MKTAGGVVWRSLRASHQKLPKFHNMSYTSDETMITAEQAFPFFKDVAVDAQPEVGTLEWAKRELAKFLEYNEVYGVLLTQAQAALVLGITRQAVAEYVKRGKLTIIESFGGKYIGSKDVIAFATREKLKGGRPSKVALYGAAFDRS